MAITISDVEAVSRIGEVMRQVAETREPVIVEWDGKPQVAVVPAAPGDQTAEAVPATNALVDWEAMADRARELIRRDLGDKPLPDIAGMIREMREERDAQLLANVLDHLRGRESGRD
jgi:hypothetical protein